MSPSEFSIGFICGVNLESIRVASNFQSASDYFLKAPKATLSCLAQQLANSSESIFFPDSLSRLVMVTPSSPHGVIDRNPVSDSLFKLMANPCILIHFRTPTPILANLRFSTHTPVRLSRLVAATPYFPQARIKASSIARIYACRSLPRGCKSVSYTHLTLPTICSV